jgi:hypothetical protein
MLDDPVPDLKGQIQTLATLLQHLNNPQALFCVSETFPIDLFQNNLSTVSKGCMPKVVAEGNSLGQIFV